MGHKNKNKRLLQGRGFSGRIKALLLAGLLVLPIVGNLVVRLDVWAYPTNGHYCVSTGTANAIQQTIYSSGTETKTDYSTQSMCENVGHGEWITESEYNSRSSSAAASARAGKTENVKVCYKSNISESDLVQAIINNGGTVPTDNVLKAQNGYNPDGTKIPDTEYATASACTDAGGYWREVTVSYDSSGNLDTSSVKVTASADAGSGGSGATDTKPDCWKNIGALGWIVCSAIDVMGSMLEWAYTTFIEPMMKIDTNMLGDPARKAWGTFQGIANIVFVIFMLVIIISQLTGLGISNLGIKRTLPRLIVAILLINLSFFICSLAVDVSNILGFSAKNLLEGLAPSIGTLTVEADPGVSGADVVDVVVGEAISGATIAAAVGGAALTVAALGLSGAIIMILLSLISAIVSVIVFFLLLSARQALVLLLVVISPVAVVLYVLPNTQNTFKKYTRLFSTTLMLYPICGAVMGAGEFASRLYLSSLGTPTSIFNLCVGVLIDVLPFMAVPKLTQKALDGVANIGTLATNFGRRTGKNLSGRVQNSEGVQRALENSRLGIKNNGELSATGKFRQAWGKSGLPGSKTNQRRTMRALQTAEQRAKEDELGNKVAAMGDNPFRAARERGLTMGDADAYGIEKRGDSAFIKAQGMQQKDRADTEVAGLVANYAKDTRNGGDQDLQRAAVNAAVVQGVTRAHDAAKMADDTYAQMNILRGTDQSEEKYTMLVDEYTDDTRMGMGGNVDNRQAAINRAKVGAAGRVANAKRIADPLAFQAAIANITSKEDRDAVDALESDLANRSTELENMTDAEQVDFFRQYVEKHGGQGMQAVAQFANDNNRNNIMTAIKQVKAQYELGRGEDGNMTLTESGQALMRRFYQGAQGNSALMKLAEVKNFAENSVFAGKAGASADIGDFAIDAQYMDADDKLHLTGAAAEYQDRLNAASIEKDMSVGQIFELARAADNGSLDSNAERLWNDLDRYLGTDAGRRSGKYDALVALQQKLGAAKKRAQVEQTMANGGDFQVRLASGGTYSVGQNVYSDLDDLTALSRNNAIVEEDRNMLASIAGQQVLREPNKLTGIADPAVRQSVINTVAPTIAGATSQEFSRVAGAKGVTEAIQTSAAAIRNLTPENRRTLESAMADKATDGTVEGTRLVAEVNSGMSSGSDEIKGFSTEVASRIITDNGDRLNTDDRDRLAEKVSLNFPTMSTETQRILVSSASTTSTTSDEGRRAANIVVDNIVTGGALGSVAPEVREQIVQQKVANLPTVSPGDFVQLATQPGLSESTTKELAAGASVGQIQELADTWSVNGYTPSAQDKAMAQELVKSGYLPDTDVTVGGIGDNRIDKIVEVSGIDRTEADRTMGEMRAQIRNEQSGATELVRRFTEINGDANLSNEDRAQAKLRVALETAPEATVGAMKDSSLSGYITTDIAREVAAANSQNAEAIARTAVQSGNVAVSKELAVDPRVQQILSGSEALRHGLDEKSGETTAELEQARSANYDARYRSASESYNQARQRSSEIADSVPGASGNYSGVRSPFGPRIGGGPPMPPPPGPGPIPGPTP